MNFDLTKRHDATVLFIAGELDALSTQELKPIVQTIAADRPHKVLVDLSGLRLIDSSGVGTLVALFKSVTAYQGALAVVGVHDQPLDILRLLRLDRVLMGDMAGQVAPYAIVAAPPEPLRRSAETSDAGGPRLSPAYTEVA